jgi:hypothetical protein
MSTGRATDFKVNNEAFIDGKILVGPSVIPNPLPPGVNQLDASRGKRDQVETAALRVASAPGVARANINAPLVRKR